MGVIGYTIPEIPIISEPGDKVTFSDVVPSMQATINILKVLALVVSCFTSIT